jgi:predicted NBD/HSP70 family sugar kinase
VVDIERGVIREAVNRGWRDLPLAELLIRRYGLPVFIANDSHMTALAEYRFGIGVGSRSLIAIKISQGIGSGVILDGRLLGGDSHAAGEIGHMVIREDGAPCTCGNQGCLETVASLRALVQRAQEEAARHPDSRLAALQAERGSIGLRELQTALQEGDPLTRALVVEAGRALGVAIAAMVSVLDVERVVLCGEGAALGPVLLEAVRAEVRWRILPRIAERVEIHLSQLGKEAVIFGASAMMIAQFFQLD